VDNISQLETRNPKRKQEKSTLQIYEPLLFAETETVAHQWLAMYGHHSSARVGVGKQGHGGRNYRPPRPRRDLTYTPPPLKECSCLLQIDIPEYQNAQPAGRTHFAFGGRDAVQEYERFLRDNFLVHLVIPGRKQQGPVAIAGKSYKETVPAAAYLMSELQSSQENSLQGRVQLYVQNLREPTIVGSWYKPCLRAAENAETTMIRPFWLFQSPSWSALVCPLVTPNDAMDGMESNDNTGETENNDSPTSGGDGPFLSVLGTCVENVIFRVGNLHGLDIFLHDNPPAAFAAGDPRQAAMLEQEIARSL
jgi:hypothetical protein